MIKLIIVFFLPALIFYLAESFIFWQINLAMWSEGARFMLIWISVSVGSFLSYGYFIFNRYEE